MLGRLRMTLDQCEQAFRELSQDIFTPRKNRANVIGRSKDFVNADGKFNAESLERAIKGVISNNLKPEAAVVDPRAQGPKSLDETQLMEHDPVCNFFVTSVFREIGNAVILRTYKNRKQYDSLSRDLKIWEACRATSAATTFFDHFTCEKHGVTFVDGRFRWNNPVQQAWNEAQDMWPDDQEKIVLLSVGTRSVRQISLEGNLAKVAKSLQSLATDNEDTAERFHRDHSDLFKEKRCIRLNVPELSDVGLEEYKRLPTIRAKTQYYLQENGSERLSACSRALEVEVLMSGSEKNHLTAFKAILSDTTLNSNSKWESIPPRVTDTCDWFLHQEDYQAWKKSSLPEILWAIGDAGCGKSVLARFMSEQHGIPQHPSEECCYFFSDSENKHSGYNNALCGMLHYLMESPFVDPEFNKLVLERFGDPGPHIVQNTDVLLDLICKATKLVDPAALPLPCILDGLDKCSQALVLL